MASRKVDAVRAAGFVVGPVLKKSGHRVDLLGRRVWDKRELAVGVFPGESLVKVFQYEKATDKEPRKASALTDVTRGAKGTTEFVLHLDTDEGAVTRTFMPRPSAADHKLDADAWVAEITANLEAAAFEESKAVVQRARSRAAAALRARTPAKGKRTRDAYESPEGAGAGAAIDTPPATPAAARDVFISHAWGKKAEDGSYPIKARALLVRDALVAEGLTTWVDTNELTASSEELDDQIAHGIAACQAFLVCFTEEYAKSEKCRLEVDIALTEGKPICVINVGGRGIVPTAIPWLKHRIGGKIYADARGRGADAAAGYAMLVNGLREHLPVAKRLRSCGGGGGDPE